MGKLRAKMKKKAEKEKPTTIAKVKAAAWNWMIDNCPEVTDELLDAGELEGRAGVEKVLARIDWEAEGFPKGYSPLVEVE